MNFTNKYKKFVGAIALGAMCLVGFVAQGCSEDIYRRDSYRLPREPFRLIRRFPYNFG